MSVLRFKTALSWLLAVLCLAALTYAQVKVEKSFTRDIDLDWREGRLELSVDFPEAFTNQLRKRLSNGFTSRILIEAILEKQENKTPVAQAIVQHTILYDIWEEKFNIRHEGPAGRHDFQVSSMAELIRTCGKLERLPLQRLVDLPAGTKVRLQVRIMVNPMSAELRKRVREYLSTPDGSSHIGSPRSFFGSFSRIFVDEKAFQADAVYTYRTPTKDMPARQGAE
jgi:hypothetical protein